MAQRDQLGDERQTILTALGQRLRPVDGEARIERGAGEQAVAAAVADLVAVVEQRHAVHCHVHDNDVVDLPLVQHALEAVAVVVAGQIVVVVVAGHQRAFGQPLAILQPCCAQRGDGLAAEQHIAQRARPVEAVEYVEGVHHGGSAEALVEHDDVRIDFVKAAARFLPEIERDAVAHVGAIAVRVEIIHIIDHVVEEIFAQRGIVEVQLREMPLAVDD